MSNCLITADLHLTDIELESYRWRIFDVLAEEALKYQVGHIFIIGDMFDRKDRHSSELVNKTISNVLELEVKTNADVFITAGNHDKPVNGPYFWEFLHQISTGHYIINPQRLDYISGEDETTGYCEVWLLPFSNNPIDAWKDLDFVNRGDAILMHQTIEGALVDGDRKIPTSPYPMPKLPEGIPIFSGDVHRPQTIQGITYVGAPYPIKFSETWDNRIILIEDANFKNYKSIPVDIMKRAILDIASADELKFIKYKPGSQLRIRYKLTGSQLTKWPVEEEIIRTWCKTLGVNLVSLEAVFEGDGLKPEANTSQIELLPPEEIIKMFCKEEKLSDEILEMGLALVKGGK